jgi:hypothetical protein
VRLVRETGKPIAQMARDPGSMRGRWTAGGGSHRLAASLHAPPSSPQVPLKRGSRRSRAAAVPSA